MIDALHSKNPTGRPIDELSVKLVADFVERDCKTTWYEIPQVMWI